MPSTDALRRLRPRGTGHDPGRIAVDLAVTLARRRRGDSGPGPAARPGGGVGPVASTPTAWRLLAGIDPSALARLRSARATAREIAWLQATETRPGIPAARAGGRDLPGLVLDLDATLVTCHSEKEQAAATCKRGFGYHPLLCFLDNTGEALAALLRPGNSDANTAADHITVLDQALAQILLVQSAQPGRDRTAAQALAEEETLLAHRGVRTALVVNDGGRMTARWEGLMGRLYVLGLDEPQRAFLGLVLSVTGIGCVPLTAVENLDERRLMIMQRALCRLAGNDRIAVGTCL